MKNLKFYEKLIFILNSIFALLLLLSFLLPWIPPKSFAIISVLGLGVPVLITLNVLFFIYWLLKLKRQLFLSLAILLIGYFIFGSLYKFSSQKSKEVNNTLTVMNYNVRLFNYYKWIAQEGIDKQISTLINEQAPDILTLQEYRSDVAVDFSRYPYKFENISKTKRKNGQAIFSKYPIINSGNIEFLNTSNSVIFADVVKGIDTLRVYNIHLQSLKISTQVNNINQEDSERLIKQIGKTFATQQTQAELFVKHKKKCTYKMIVSGDLNNTDFSYVYRLIKDDLNDTFKYAGSGFGRTHELKYFPMRIDFILADKTFKIVDFKTFKAHYSDHFPIMTTLSI